MRKILVLALMLSLTATVSASEFVEGRHYVELKYPVEGSSHGAVHFFSFYCTQCFLASQILKNMSGITVSPDRITKQHVTYGPLGEFLSRAWIVADQLGVSDKVETPIFTGIQNQTIDDEAAVKEIFLRVGVDPEVFDAHIDNPEITSIVNQQARQIRQLGFNTIPALVVNNRFVVDLAELPWNDSAVFGQQYSQMINELLSRPTG